MKSILKFCGGAGEVTGANFLLDTGGAKLLVDCGLIQGAKFAVEKNCAAFAYKPADVATLLVTHAHADHIGRIPKLVRDGFAGKIISTEATKDLAEVMLQDALMVMRMEAKHHQVEPCYDEDDVVRSLALWQGVSYGDLVDLPDSVSAEFQDCGHILGSANITLRRADKSFVFTGDIGNTPQPLLDAPVVPKGYDYLLMESVYGDRLHEGVSTRTEKLKEYIEEVRRSGGVLLIPAFSLERTQAMLLEINNFIERGEIEEIPVYLDSPLAIKVTELYRKHAAYMSQKIQSQIKDGDDIFDFPGVHISRSKADSEAIHHTKGPKIIIAGSGMSHGGRILSHEKAYLDGPQNTVLLVGYQAVGTAGRILQDGGKAVRIDGQMYAVRAKVRTIDGYSGHADRDQLVDFVAQGGEKAKNMFVVMGEEKAALFLTQRLRDFLGAPAEAPQEGDTVEIEF